MKHTTKNMPAAVFLSAIILGVNGCAFDGAIRDDFYRPSSGGAKLPIQVALLDNEALRPVPVERWGMDNFHVTVVPGFTNAVKAELTSLFQDVKSVRDLQQARNDDMIVIVESAFMTKVDDARKDILRLTLRPPGWKEDLARYESSVEVQGSCHGMCAAAPVLTGLSLLTLMPIVMPWGAASATGYAVENLEEATTTMLRDLSTKVRNDARVLAFVEQKKALQSSVAAGEEAERSGDRLKALEQYARAWQARPNNDLERRLQEKIAKLATGLAALPLVPEEARRYHARAGVFLKTATAEGYGKVVNEMQQAVKVAPLWAEAYYNLGFIQESAGQYTDAIRSLKLYLLLAPRSSDAQAVQTKVYELEAAAEMSMRNSG